MVSSFFLMLIAPIVAIIIGFAFVILPLVIVYRIKDWLEVRKIKKMDKEEFKKILLVNPHKIDEKEDEEDGKEEQRKFREFEKIRRIARTSGGEGGQVGLYNGEGDAERRGTFQDFIASGTPTDKKRIKLND